MALVLTTYPVADTNAQTMDFMEYSPITHYTEQDHRLADEAALDALDNHADGETKKWSNPDTGASGAITVVRTYKNEAGLRCRRAKAVDRTRTPPLRGEFTFDLCKDPERGWQFVRRKK